MYERAPYASDPASSRGRLYETDESPNRTPFQRDRDRIIHSTAFRRLKQKTQVFVAHEGDHHRTRLTHSLEVAQIARSIARTLKLDEDLAEALALAHDLGHPPFGHAGEAALHAAMREHGGFDHNAQTLRIVTFTEQRYPDHDGLNLTWEMLEGVVKHNGPVITKETDEAELPWALTEYEDWRGLELSSFAGMEAQAAAVADDIAYNNHDIDDGLRARLFRIDDLIDVPFVGEIFADVRRRWPELETSRVIHEAVREMIGAMIEDVTAESRRRLAEIKPRSAENVRVAGRPLIGFSEEFREKEKPLREFLFQNMYRHPDVNRKMSLARRVVRKLFELYMEEPNVMPREWARGAEQPDRLESARMVCDYVSGMTDRYALEQFRRLFSVDGYF